MADIPDLPAARPPMSSTQAIGFVLKIAAVLGGIGAVIWLVAQVWDLSQQPADSVSGSVFLSKFALFLIALVPCALVMGVAELLSRVDTIVKNDATVIANTAAAAAARAMPTNSAMAADKLDEMTLLLREMRDITLLNDSQRTKRLEAQGRAAVEVLLREVPVLLREHNWIEARARVQEARERYPHVPEWDAMERQIEQMRAQVEQHDIEAAERQINDLTALGAWDRIGDVMRELIQRHPDSVKVNELAQKIRAMRNKAEVELRSRLMTQAQESTNKRDWKSAYSLALQIIERYPRSPDAQALRLQLPTLRENAEVQARQRMETEIREFVRMQRFGDAIRVGHEMIQQYPHSPQAEALRAQLPKLQERAVAR
jgi:hypothetical protein